MSRRAAICAEQDEAAAQERAAKDFNDKHALIDSVCSEVRTLAQFFNRCGPDFYPPPLNTRILRLREHFVAFLNMLEVQRGETPTNAKSDDDIYKYLSRTADYFSDSRFPKQWTFAETETACASLWDVSAELTARSFLTREENALAPTPFTNDDALDPLPESARTRMERAVLDSKSKAPWLGIRDAGERLTALIAPYIAEKTVLIGNRTNEDNPIPLYYRTDERFRHSYIIGKTGSGKSTLLRYLITQDLHKGNGVIVLSPENDLYEKLMPYIPAERADDLIYFDPTDTKLPVIGFNPFHLESGEDLTQKVGETLTTFIRALGDLGVSMETLMQNAIYALLQMPNSTFQDIDLLLDPHTPTLRRKVTANRHIDAKTRRFWQQYETSGYYKKAYEPVVNRLDPFFREPLATSLSTPSLSFKESLNTRPHIIFLNLSRLRGVQAETVGQLLIAQIQQALLVREEIPEAERIPYYFYIDEFQTYAAHNEESLISLFNGARKYRLAVTLAHQTTGNIPPKLLDTIIGNVGTVIALQLAANDAPLFARELQIRKADTDGSNPAELQNLSIGEGYARTPSRKSGVKISLPAQPIVPLPDPATTPAPDELKSRSKKNFGIMPQREEESEDETEDYETEDGTDDMPVVELSEPEATEQPEPMQPAAPRPTKKRVPKTVVRQGVTPKHKKSILPDEDETIEVR